MSEEQLLALEERLRGLSSLVPRQAPRAELIERVVGVRDVRLMTDANGVALIWAISSTTGRLMEVYGKDMSLAARDRLQQWQLAFGPVVNELWLGARLPVDWRRAGVQVVRYDDDPVPIRIRVDIDMADRSSFAIETEAWGLMRLLEVLVEGLSAVRSDVWDDDSKRQFKKLRRAVAALGKQL